MSSCQNVLLVQKAACPPISYYLLSLLILQFEPDHADEPVGIFLTIANYFGVSSGQPSFSEVLLQRLFLHLIC